MSKDNQQIGATEEIKRLHSLIGDWNIQYQTRNDPSQPFVEHRITSKIISILDGAFIQEQISIPAASSSQIDLIGILGYDRYRKLYRFAWLDNAYAMFDVHEGNWENDVLIVNNLRSKTTFQFEGQDYFSGMKWYQITPNSFTVESILSLDSGKTWFVQVVGKYTRR